MTYRSEACGVHPEVPSIGACAGCATRGCKACLFPLPPAEFICRACIASGKVKRTLPVFAVPQLSLHRWMLSARYFLATAEPMRAIWCHVDVASARGLLVLHALLGAAVLVLAALTTPWREGSLLWLIAALVVSWPTFQVALSWVLRRDPAMPPAEVAVRLAFAQPVLVIACALALVIGPTFPPVRLLPALALTFVAWGIGGQRPLAATLAALGLLIVLGVPLSVLVLALTGGW